MKANTISKIAALVLAIAMSLSLAACGSTPNVSLDNVGIGDNVSDPAPEGFTINWGHDDDGKDSDSTSTAGTAKTSKAMGKNSLKAYGEVITVVKSVSKPTANNSKNVQDTSYGKVDWSMAAQGYIEFTAKGAERILILQGPNDITTNVNVAKDETVKVALIDGTGKYQYAIGNLNTNSSTIKVLYKNSFSVGTIDSGLAPYLVSTPYGDYENAPNAVKQADELWNTKKTQLDNIKAIAKWVKDNVDYDRASRVGTLSVYVDPDEIIENGKGVCNEMAKVIVAMLRSQGIPAYVQHGTNAKGNDHLWVMAWVELSSETKNDTTYSTGAWVSIEATGGRLNTNSIASQYTPSNYKG